MTTWMERAILSGGRTTVNSMNTGMRSPARRCGVRACHALPLDNHIRGDGITEMKASTPSLYHFSPRRVVSFLIIYAQDELAHTLRTEATYDRVHAPCASSTRTMSAGRTQIHASCHAPRCTPHSHTPTTHTPRLRMRLRFTARSVPYHLAHAAAARTCQGCRDEGTGGYRCPTHSLSVVRWMGILMTMRARVRTRVANQDMVRYFRTRDELASVAVSEPDPASLAYGLGSTGGHGYLFDTPAHCFSHDT
ncbi:hypothetical protein EDB85DRAFT_1130838 [Lactarius pseudohatsudake]|nr:hypothetical protein EDB85DRAFT_1130838 [Lactarius pseudohatsudake]